SERRERDGRGPPGPLARRRSRGPPRRARRFPRPAAPVGARRREERRRLVRRLQGHQSGGDHEVARRLRRRLRAPDPRRPQQGGRSRRPGAARGGEGAPRLPDRRVGRRLRARARAVRPARGSPREVRDDRAGGRGSAGDRHLRRGRRALARLRELRPVPQLRAPRPGLPGPRPRARARRPGGSLSDGQEARLRQAPVRRRGSPGRLRARHGLLGERGDRPRPRRSDQPVPLEAVAGRGPRPGRDGRRHARRLPGAAPDRGHLRPARGHRRAARRGPLLRPSERDATLVLPGRPFDPALRAREARADPVRRAPDLAQARPGQPARPPLAGRGGLRPGLRPDPDRARFRHGGAARLDGLLPALPGRPFVALRGRGVRARAASPLRAGDRRALSPRAFLRLFGSREGRARQRLSGAPVADRDRLGGAARPGRRAEPPEALLPAPPGVGLHLRHPVRRAGHARRAPPRRPVRRRRLARLPGRPARAGRLRPLSRLGLHDRDRAPGAPQHQRRPRPPADQGHPAAVHLLRRLLARGHDDRLRRAAQPLPARMTMTAPAAPSATAPRARHALLAGGGTGGHVFPALAVGEELAARGWTISYAGSSQGLEARLVPARGWAFNALPARPFLGRGLGAKLGALTLLVRSGLAARRLVRRLSVDAVLGTGGYASAPAVAGARLAGRPVLLLALNARAGFANRALSRCATAAAVAWEATRRDLKCPVVVTGVPVRPAFFALPRALPDGPPRLLVLGGSQGAQQMNRALPEAARILLERIPDLAIVHQAGAKNLP